MDNNEAIEVPDRVATRRINFDDSATDKVSTIPAFLTRRTHSDPTEEFVEQDTVQKSKSHKDTQLRADIEEAVREPAESGSRMRKKSSNPSIINLEDLSLDELKQQEEQIRRKIEEKRAAEKKAVIDQIAHILDVYSISTEELVQSLGGVKIKRKGVKAPPKYRDPETGATWSGRGKEPAWIKGQDRDKFLIQED